MRRKVSAGVANRTAREHLGVKRRVRDVMKDSPSEKGYRVSNASTAELEVFEATGSQDL